MKVLINIEVLLCVSAISKCKSIKSTLFIYLFIYLQQHTSQYGIKLKAHCSLHNISNYSNSCNSDTCTYEDRKLSSSVFPQKKLPLVINPHILSCHTGIIDSSNFICRLFKAAGKVPTEQHGKISPSGWKNTTLQRLRGSAAVWVRVPAAGEIQLQ